MLCSALTICYFLIVIKYHFQTEILCSFSDLLIELGVDHAALWLKISLKDLLLYCLLSGWEWWDVLMAAHLGTPAG